MVSLERLDVGVIIRDLLIDFGFMVVIVGQRRMDRRGAQVVFSNDLLERIPEAQVKDDNIIDSDTRSAQSRPARADVRCNLQVL